MRACRSPTENAAENNAKHQNKTKTDDDGPGVLLFERVKEEFVPAIDRERCAKICEEKEENGKGQKPRLRSRPTIPKSKSELKEPSRPG